MEDILHRQSPHSPEAEQSVLGSMLIEASCIPDVVGMIRADHFYVTQNKDIFETMYSMFSFSQKIDPVTLLNKMVENGIGNDDLRDYVLHLMRITPTAVNVMEYAAIVKDKAMLRALAEMGREVNAMAISEEGGSEAVLEAAEKRVYALRSDKGGGELQAVSKILADVFGQISTAAKLGGRLPGVSTGLHDLDRFIMGLNDSDLVLIASRPGMGKTSMAMGTAMHAAKTSGKSVAVFSLEMSREQLAMRLLSSESLIDGKKLITGRISKESDWQRLADACSKISALPLYINDNPSLTVADMNAQCRRVKNLGLVVIDYLQLMQSATGKSSYSENRTQAVSEISRMMKIMAKELSVPVVCLSQLSRANESRENKRPRLSDLRESGAIEQDADIVLGLYRDDYYNAETESHNIAECIILKNRRGETGTCELQWLPEYTTYSSLEKKREG